LHVRSGPFVALISDSAGDIEEPEQPLLHTITAQLPSVAAFIEAQELNPSSRNEVLEALSTLGSCLEFANAPLATTRELRFLFIWPNRITGLLCCGVSSCRQVLLVP
jgi:hypothetical protein